jgi:hypothetical protein
MRRESFLPNKWDVDSGALNSRDSERNGSRRPRRCLARAQEYLRQYLYY